MRTYLRIINFARPFGVVVPVYTVLILFHTVFRVVNFTALIPVLQLLFNTEFDYSAITKPAEFTFSDRYFIDLFQYHFGNIILAEGRLPALYFVCAILLISVLLANVFQYMASLIQAYTRVKAVSNLRSKIFERITLLDLSYFTETRKGDIMSRVTTDVQQIESAVVNTLKVLFREPFLIIGFFFALFRISVELTLYTMVLLPISSGVISFIAKRLKRTARKAQESIARMTGILEETLSGMRIVKAFTARKYTIDKFNREVDQYGKHNYGMAVKFNLAGPISEFLGVSFLSIILLIGGRMVLGENAPLDAAAFIVFLIIFSQVLNPAKSISSAFTNIQRGIASGDRIFEIIDKEPEIVDGTDAMPISGFKKSIRFESVDFTYDSQRILHGLDFEIPKGRIIALVGPSGAGKSTIAELIPRFYDAENGAVTIDGINVSNLRINDLRKLIGVVTQESILFNDTVFRNISFGKPEATIEEVERAAKIANAHDFIMDLEEGYNTLVGERGSKLSGGQRQRLSIARAILKNPPILILDEATSALDSESEKLVQDAIFKLMQNRTTLVIAHRLSTIQNSDEIIVMEKGEIVERGDHDTLISKDGIYNKFIEMQSV